jgi:hypothetical protein
MPENHLTTISFQIVERSGAAPVTLPPLIVKLRGNCLQIDRQQLTAVIQAALDNVTGAVCPHAGIRPPDRQLE